MKRHYTCIIILFFSTGILCGQSIEELNVKLDNLNQKIDSIDMQISDLKISKDQFIKQINDINQKKLKLEIENEYDIGIPVTINEMGGILRDKPNISGTEIVKIPKGDTVLVFFWYEKPYFKAAYKEKVGFISFSSLNKSDKIESIINKYNTEENPRLVFLTNKYGVTIAKRIIKGEYWIGMTAEMARASLGYPDDINKSTGSWGVHEQWVYSNKKIYIYFENGKLTSIQD